MPGPNAGVQVVHQVRPLRRDSVEVGRGADIWIDTPAPGRREVRVEVAGRAGIGSATSPIEVPAAKS
jgi:hypothetical protein